MLIINFRLRDSRWGRAWLALRDDEEVAVHAASRSCAPSCSPMASAPRSAGSSGSFLASYLATVNPSQFTFSFSIFILAMVVLGGLGSIWGVVLGSLILSAINNYLLPKVLYDVLAGLRPLDIASGIYGFLLVVMVVLRPQGMLPAVEACEREDPPAWRQRASGSPAMASAGALPRAAARVGATASSSRAS